MIIFWIVATVAFVALEAATVGLVSIWFAIGSACALVAAALKAGFWVQLIVFISVSAVVLAFLRPLVRKYLKVRAKPTNADKVLGTVCPVTEAIDNIAGTGAVVAGGKEWTARSVSGAPIPQGEKVGVVSIRGVTLMVEKVRQGAEAKRTPASAEKIN